MTAKSVQQRRESQIWDTVVESTKAAQERNTDPLMWAVNLSAALTSAGIRLPSTEVAQLLVSHICFDNHVPIAWKLLERSLSLNISPPPLVLSLLSVRVIPNRKVQPAAYRLYLELVKRHAFSLSSLINGPNYHKIMDSINNVLHLSDVFGPQMHEPGELLVGFVFSMIWQLLEASLDDEGALELHGEKEYQWLMRSQDMEIDGQDGFSEKRIEQQEGMKKGNTIMAIELIGEFLKQKATSRIILLARQNLPSQWNKFFLQLQLLVTHSAALRNSKLVTPESLLRSTSYTCKLMSREPKTTSLQEFHTVISSRFLISSGDECRGTSRAALWLPFDLFLEHNMDGSQQVAATSAVVSLTELVKALQAVNGTTWHDTFLGLWIAALRLVQRERDSSEGPVPRIDTSLCMLLSITPLAVAELIEEEESELIENEESEDRHSGQKKEKQGSGERRMGLATALQSVADCEGLLTPPQSVTPVANQAAAKAALFVSGVSSANGYYESLSMNDMPINFSGNLRHLIVEACIARNLLDTSAYLWPGYVNVFTDQVPCVPGQPGWSSIMKGLPLSPSLVNALVATPASSLTEIEKIYEIAANGTDHERFSAATILCGASLSRGWSIQEHTLLFIIRLLSPPAPSDFAGTESHLLNYAPMLNVLLVGLSSVDCVQILSLHGMVPLLAGALMPICEVFGSRMYSSWTLPTGEEISSHAVFSNAFTLLLRLWRFDHPPIEHVMGDVPPVGSQLSPEYLLLVRNTQLATFGISAKDRLKVRRYSKILNMSVEPVFLDSFPKLQLWYRQHLECIASTFSGLVHGTPVHQIVDALLSVMFRRINRGGSVPSLTSSTSGSSSSSVSGAEDAYARLRIPAWDILEATPFVLDAALTACAHGRLSPRELTTGLKDLADFLPASLAPIVSFFSAEVTRGIWKPAFMNGTDWPSPAANLSSVEQQIKKLLSATGVNVPSLPVGGTAPATLPLPLAALLSLTITYKLDKASERFLTMVGPALSSLGAGCPWPCMPIITSLWAQKVKRWSDYLVFSASGTVFHHNSDAVVQLLKSCFTSTLGFSSRHICSNGGVGALLGHGFGSHFYGGMTPVAPGLLYLRVHRSVRNVMFMTEEILSLLMHFVREIASSGLARETRNKLRKTKYGMRYGNVSLAMAMTRVKHAASLGASLVWITGGSCLVQALIKETLPSWFISTHGPENEHGESSGMVAMLGGYALAYFALLCGTFAWGVDKSSPESKRRPKILSAHLEFLASALERKITLGCDWATARAYVTGFVSLMVACTPTWLLEVDLELLKRLSNGLRKWNEEELALAVLGLGGIRTMGTTAELIIDTRI